ncbi:MAG TPA: pyridoxamine 5'-phosphate oxidase family protein [Pseudonocardia sp.]|nr:pyridoxamine 5'-phosphate oxidase family protein [Pseudonocardia sp.]
MASVFHPGELAAQRRAGLRAEADRVGGIVRTDVPPAAAVFLAEQRMLVISGADDQDRMWASLLTGERGFLRAGTVAGLQAIDIAARPLGRDPLAEALTAPTRIGSIALDPATRRRMRINGVAGPVGAGLRLMAEQVYANCPKYIQRREVVSARTGGPDPAATVATGLSDADRRMITEADTFFIATTSAAGHRDASHRGGNPGFVHLDPDGGLSWPDYPGNAMMMTLGNLEQNPRAGLLFLDWSTGTTLQLTGTAPTEWTGSERRSRFHVDEVRRTELASPLSWTEPEYSRFNPVAGTPRLAS